MNLRAQIRRLERQALRRSSSANEDEFLEEDWLSFYEDLANQDVFAREPDFPIALAAYRRALAEARDGQPPLDPPANYESRQPERQRIAQWRLQHFYPALNSAWLWLSEFFERVQQDIPPVPQTEFRELADWFDINQEHLIRAEATSDLLEVSGGRRTSLTNLRCGLIRGYRVRGVGSLAEDLRYLRAHHG
jgi:hypothetical protein